MANVDDNQQTISTSGPASLIQQIQECQDVLAEQQRALLRTPDELTRATALRNAGHMARWLEILRAQVEDLNREFHHRAAEQERQRALQEVGAAINSSLDLNIVLQQVMDAIVRLTKAERAMLLLDDDGELEVKIARNLSQETLNNDTSLEISRGIVRQVAETGVPVVTLNAQEDARFSAQHSVVSYKLRSILCVPLKLRGETIGVIYADNRVASGIFSDSDRDLLAAFADQAAVAVDNARLFYEVAEMKQLMDNVFASISSGVITMDEHGHVTLYNRAAERILGETSSAILAGTEQALLEALGIPGKDLIQRVRTNGQTHNTEIDLDIAGLPDNPTTINLTLSPLHTVNDERLGGVALVLNDVSEQKRVESLRRYLPPALVDQVRDLDSAQRPQRRAITVLFADVRDFSRLGEKFEPEDLIDLVNGAFSEAVAAISENHGLIDKFMGDAIMALFNTPLNPQSDHVERAVHAALAIQSRLAAYRHTLPSEKALHFGIGIHTGEAVVGNVGSEQRKDYSAVGDVVNLCKRLQELAGADQILISRNVYDNIREEVRVESLPPVHVKGRQAQEEVFHLLGELN
ncbi:MAG TPA: adenylate/guanylate cyclase domain-containing protein [Promineifilum sp.]|nr:GAF domain-containing protein [Promineifilum sp.]HNS39128.1 adenylate/guanylate cyclase domain-containing protein [Promineifilum sp.]